MPDETILQAGELAGASLQCGTSPPRRILVVDEEPGIRQFVTEALILSGYEADAVENGAVAWDALQQNNYDLLVADNDMDELTGIGLIKKLHAARLAVPVILVSEAMLAAELNRHPWLQIEAALLKPFSAAELLATVRNVLYASDSAAAQAAPAEWLNHPPATDLRL